MVDADVGETGMLMLERGVVDADVGEGSGR